LQLGGLGGMNRQPCKETNATKIGAHKIPIKVWREIPQKKSGFP
jgi:hypothetical protein